MRLFADARGGSAESGRRAWPASFSVWLSVASTFLVSAPSASYGNLSSLARMLPIFASKFGSVLGIDGTTDVSLPQSTLTFGASG